MLKISSKIPFDPKRIPFFYGWIILFCGVVGVIMSIPGQTMGFSVFTDYLIKDLGLSRLELSTAYMIGTMMSGLLITFAGILYDKAGARIVAIGASVFLGAMLIYLSGIENIVEFFSKLFQSFHRNTLTFVLMVLGFFGVRFFGQGVLTMTSRNMVMKWFDKRRGLANGILGVFTTIAFSYSPRLLHSIIKAEGWQNTYFLLALVIVFFLLFVFISFRDNPQDAGLLPDGKEIKPRLKGVKSTSETDYNLPEVIRTYSFWMFIINIFLIALYVTAYTFNVESIFNKAGFSSDAAFSVFFPIAIIAAFVHVFGSMISDYIKLKYILILSYFGLIISICGLLFISDFGFNIFIIGSGIILGTYYILIALTWPRFYGLKHLGKISGFAISLGVIGSSLGPFIFSLSEKHSNSYQGGLIFTLIISFIMFIMAFWTNNLNDKSSGFKKNKL